MTQVISGIGENDVVAVEEFTTWECPKMGMPQGMEDGERSPFAPQPHRDKGKVTWIIPITEIILNTNREIIKIENLRRDFVVGGETVHALARCVVHDSRR